MKIGFFGINFGVCGDPVAMIQVAKAAEQAGLESVWTGEHVVLPDPRVAPSPSEPQTLSFAKTSSAFSFNNLEKTDITC
jgi:alkanesulfonate monooxygenase SsuD/methylene tetrahydromethanopterin reductase-like flavin-dependent oxidoreductase (luciferase family)